MQWQRAWFIRRAGATWHRSSPYSFVFSVYQASCIFIHCVINSYQLLTTFRKFSNYYRAAKMRALEKARYNGFSSILNLLRSFILRNHDANASSSILPPGMDLRWLSVSGLPICVLQQRLRLDVVYDSDDNQSLHFDHFPAFVPENLSNEIYHTSAVHGLVYLFPYHGE